MDNPPLITFLSDFGPDSGYPAACELVITSVCPSARVVHLSHSVPRGDVRHGAHLLRLLAPQGPPAVHLAVVDPGVGTDRAGVCLLSARGDYFIGPDNGLLVPAADGLGGIVAVWDLSGARTRAAAGLSAAHSHTFHGRDLFAPAAALLARGEAAGSLGTERDTRSLARVPPQEPTVGPDSILAHITEIDTFGNIQLDIPWALLTEWLPSGEGRRNRTGKPEDESYTALVVRVPDHDRAEGELRNGAMHLPGALRIVRTYADLGPEEAGVLQDSWGYVSIAVRGGRAAAVFGVSLHDSVRLIRAAKTDRSRNER